MDNKNHRPLHETQFSGHWPIS